MSDSEPQISSTLPMASHGHVSPQDLTALVMTIRSEWASHLGVSNVDPDDDFFDLGGSSLNAAEAMANLGERLGVELPVRSLFEAPTAAEMASLVREIQGLERGGQSTGAIDGVTPFYEPWVVPLHTMGARRPIWVFPGGMGGVWTLKRDAQVATLVGSGHPFFGFQRDPSPIGYGRDDWIEAVAATYVEQIRLIQGRGPYLLYGICAGGSLAWETAAQLLASGEKIAGMLFYEVALAPHSYSATLPPQAGRSCRYRPVALPVNLTLLMTEAWQAQDRSAGWKLLAEGEVDAIVMPGDTPGAHNLYANRMPTIAAHLRDWIARSEARLRR